MFFRRGITLSLLLFVQRRFEGLSIPISYVGIIAVRVPTR